MSSSPAPQRAARHHRGPIVVGVLAVVVVASGIGYVVWKRTLPPEPPAVSLDGLDPVAVETLEEARAAVRQAPRSGSAWGKLGMIYFAFGYADESGFCLHWAGVRDPENARWPYLEALTALDKPDLCLPLLARVLEKSPLRSAAVGRFAVTGATGFASLVYS